MPTTLARNAAALAARVCVALLLLPDGLGIAAFTRLAGYLAARGVRWPEPHSAILASARVRLRARTGSDKPPLHR
jgi:hypothetical protein